MTAIKRSALANYRTVQPSRRQAPGVALSIPKHWDTIMFQTHTVEIEWAGRPLKLETGRIARQSDGAVLATYGGTSVLATAVAAKEPRAGIDFFPLTVNYQEKTFAAGKIPGRLFQARRAPHRKGNPNLAADRPADPAAVRLGLQERDASYCHRALP